MQYSYTHMHIHIYIYIYIYTHTHTQVGMQFVALHTHTHTYIQTYIHVGMDAIFDAYYWVFSGAFDPGAAGKAPDTTGARLVMLGHWFFLVIVAATYTGCIGPFLTAAADVMTIK